MIHKTFDCKCGQNHGNLSIEKPPSSQKRKIPVVDQRKPIELKPREVPATPDESFKEIQMHRERVRKLFFEKEKTISVAEKRVAIENLEKALSSLKESVISLENDFIKKKGLKPISMLLQILGVNGPAMDGRDCLGNPIMNFRKNVQENSNGTVARGVNLEYEARRRTLTKVFVLMKQDYSHAATNSEIAAFIGYNPRTLSAWQKKIVV